MSIIQRPLFVFKKGVEFVKKGSKLKVIKKVLMGGKGYVRIGVHTYNQMVKRGYSRGDLVSCIMSGKIHEVQMGFNRRINQVARTYVLTGIDTSQNPIVVVLSEEGENHFSVVTVMPPTDQSRFIDCIV
jgi:hypothetical protein